MKALNPGAYNHRVDICEAALLPQNSDGEILRDYANLTVLGQAYVSIPPLSGRQRELARALMPPPHTSLRRGTRHSLTSSPR